MRPMFLSKRSSLLVAALAIAASIALWRLPGKQADNPILLEFVAKTNGYARFRMVSSKSRIVNIEAVRVEVQKATGWETFAGNTQFSIADLSVDGGQELFERVPTNANWRFSVLYRPELTGVSKLMAKIHDIWQSRTFAYWKKEHFSDDVRLVSDEFKP